MPATFDCFGGLLTFGNGVAGPTGPGGPNQQTATCNQSTTTVTCTVTDATKYAVNEPMLFTGSGTAMDWNNAVCTSHLTNSQAGGWLITNISGNTLTLSSPISQTVGASTGSIRPARWYVANVSGGSRLFTPNNTWLYSQQVVQADSAAIAKYGNNNCNTAKQEYIDWQYLNFNSTGQSNVRSDYYDSGACPGNNRIPFMQEQFYSLYASNNLVGGTWGGLNQAIKDMNYPLGSSNYVTQGTKRGALDYFDLNWLIFLQGFPQTFNNSVVTFAKSAFLMGISLDDTGISGGPTNAGWNFHTLPNGRNDSHYGLLVAATSPLQTYAGQGLYLSNAANSFKHLYKDPKVYSKLSAATQIYGSSFSNAPPTTCNISTPCALQDFLCGSTGSRYATIGALNGAWGTSYTTCGSSQNVITGEVAGTGDGTTLVFSHTFANPNVTRNSIQITISGVVVGGDCPSGQKGCTVQAGKGDISGIIMSGGNITYTSGAATLTFTAGNAPPAGFAVKVNYTTGGWMSGGTGLMDESGSHLGANGVCPFIPPAFQNSHTYAINDMIADGTNSWQIVTTAGTTQSSGAPVFSATAGTTATSGSVTFTSIGRPVCGTNGDYTGAVPNATMGKDLDDWLLHYTTAYIGTASTALKQTFPDMPFWGTDQLGVALAPPNKNVLTAAQQFVDVAMTSLWDSSQDPVGPAKFSFYTQFFQKVISNYQTPVSSQSAFTCGGNVPCFSTQQARGQWWYAFNSYWQSQQGFDGLTHGGAVQWTSNVDGLQTSSFGFKDALYNLWDGVEDTPATVPCSGPLAAFNCGGQAIASYNLADGITTLGCGNCLQASNALWFASGTTLPLAPISGLAIPMTIGR